MKELNVLFMGSPSFSVSVLEELNKNVNVVGVVTAPDAYVGRKKVLTMCPVKEKAISLGLKVYSPIKLRSDYEFIKELNPDMIITCAYGQILCEEILNIPKLGCFNLHGSLLPKYRGGAPIHYALLNGDEKTGITLMYMDKGMDSGDMIAKEEIKIEDNDNIESLTNKLSIVASNMIIKYLPSLIDGTNNRVKQDISKVTFSPIITREDEHLDFNVTAKEIFNRYRMLSPNPLPNIKIDDIEYKIAECKIVDAIGKVSTVVSKDKNSFTIMAKDKGIMVSKIKPIGKNIMNVKDFFNGYHDEIVGKEVK